MTFHEAKHPRGTAGRFTAKPHSRPEITMTEQVTCPECGADRARGVAHRCSAPGLLTLTLATGRVLAACRAAGGRPLIVGGSVRDALTSRDTSTPPKDIDIEVYDVTGFDTLQTQLGKLGRVDLTGASFGVLKLSIGREDFDVSFPRTDSKTGTGHRGFETTPDATLDEVAACGRRDFTVNAMGWDPDTEELVDPYAGAADLEAGILRHTTNAFAEDPLRVLRGAQFAARFGFDLASETAELAHGIADQYDTLAVERVWGEWRKIATRGIHISKAIGVLEDTGWLAHFPALADTRGCPQDPVWHPEGDVLTHQGLAADSAAAAAIAAGLNDTDREIAVLGALLHDVGKPATTVHGDRITSSGHDGAGDPIARQFLTSIGAPTAVANKIGPIVREHMCHASTDHEPSGPAVRRLIRRLSAGPDAPTIYDWARVVAADADGRGNGSKPNPAAAWIAVAERVGPTPRKALLRGEHLFAAGWTAGPSFAAVIRASVTAQDDGAFDDETGAVAWFREHGEAIRIAAKK